MTHMLAMKWSCKPGSGLFAKPGRTLSKSYEPGIKGKYNVVQLQPEPIQPKPLIPIVAPTKAMKELVQPKPSIDPHLAAGNIVSMAKAIADENIKKRKASDAVDALLSLSGVRCPSPVSEHSSDATTDPEKPSSKSSAEPPDLVQSESWSSIGSCPEFNSECKSVDSEANLLSAGEVMLKDVSHYDIGPDGAIMLKGPNGGCLGVLTAKRFKTTTAQQHEVDDGLSDRSASRPISWKAPSMSLSPRSCTPTPIQLPELSPSLPSATPPSSSPPSPTAPVGVEPQQRTTFDPLAWRARCESYQLVSAGAPPVVPPAVVSPPQDHSRPVAAKFASTRLPPCAINVALPSTVLPPPHAALASPAVSSPAPSVAMTHAMAAKAMSFKWKPLKMRKSARDDARAVPLARV